MIERFDNWDVAVSAISKRSPSLVFVEGVAHAGKTPFARAVARSIGALVLSTDCFLRSGGNDTPYPELVDRDALDLLIVGARRPIIVEGICLREIVGADYFDDAITIYIQRISADGSWPLQSELAEFVREDWPLCIEVEVLDYHKRFRPQDVANVIVSLSDEDRPKN